MSALTNFDRLIVVRVLRDFSVGFVMVCRVVACLGSVDSSQLCFCAARAVAQSVTLSWL